MILSFRLYLLFPTNHLYPKFLWHQQHQMNLKFLSFL